MKLRIILLFFTLFSFHSASYELLGQQSFNKQEWKRITRDIDYRESEEQRRIRQRLESGDGKERTSDGPAEIPLGNFTLFPFAGSAFKIALIILFIVVLVFVLNKILGKNIFISNKKVDSADSPGSPDDLEEDLMNSDLQKWLQKALKEGNYRLAMRIYYLMIIQELANQGMIRWRKEKTNMDYVHEMQDHPSFLKFEKITVIYQLLWYGDKKAEESYLLKANGMFKDYFDALNQVGR